MKTLKDKIVGRPLQLNKQVLKPKKGKDYAEVVFIGDVHLGSPQCDVGRFLRMIDYCYKNNLYIFLMGDLIEMATRDSIGAGVYEQEFIGQSQFELMVDYLTPLAEKRLILGILAGNHEKRVYDRTGVDVSKAFARELQIPYLGDAGWNKWKVGNQTYYIYTLHGRTNARFEGTALLALERLSASFSADLVAMGHAHKIIFSSVLVQEIVGNQIVEKKKHLVLTGSYLKYTGGYAQTMGLPISKLGSPKVKFFSKVHDIHISI